jgi:hypothetical protein
LSVWTLVAMAGYDSLSCETFQRKNPQQTQPTTNP